MTGLLPSLVAIIVFIIGYFAINHFSRAIEDVRRGDGIVQDDKKRKWFAAKNKEPELSDQFTSELESGETE